jgi:hypothetical protein
VTASTRTNRGVTTTGAAARARVARYRARTQWSLPLTIPILTMVLAGCGSSDNGMASKSAAEILAATRTAAQSASSVLITNRSNLGKTKATLDASLATDHGHARVAFPGTTFEAIRITSTLYVKGNRAFDAQLERGLGVKVPVGVWLKGSASGPLAQLGSIANIKNELPLLLGGQGALKKGSATKINGQPTIELKQEHKLYTATLYVATIGTPYPILRRTTGHQTGQTTFTGWNDPVTVTAPTNAVELSQLQHLKAR